MRRFRGEGLPVKPRIALITSDALGNYVAVTPLLQLLRSRYPDCILHYFGGSRTEELWDSEPCIDKGFPVLGVPLRDALAEVSREFPYDLVINLENADWARCLAAQLCSLGSFVVGPTLDPEGRRPLPFEEGPRGDLWRDDDWSAADLTQRYEFLASGFISEIFCRLCYLDGPVPRYSVQVCEPHGAIPDVLVSTAASLSEKLWHVGKWLELVAWLKGRGLSVGVIGAARPSQSKYWLGGEAEDVLISEMGVADLRGRLSLPQVAGALAKARLVVTIDNGILHLAAAMGAPTVGLFRPAIQRLWAPPVPTLRAVCPNDRCPVAGIPVAQVVAQIGL